MIELKSPTIEVMIRIRVLYKVIEELVKAFYSEANLETIRKGIFERQYFEKLFIYFLNKAGNKVGEVIIMIDWDKHRIATNTGNGGTFDIDTNKSINEQISELFPKIITYIQSIKQHLGVQKTEIWYGWRDEIYYDKNKLKEARHYCGFEPENKSVAPRWETLEAKKIIAEFIPGTLNELGLKITHFK